MCSMWFHTFNGKLDNYLFRFLTFAQDTLTLAWVPLEVCSASANGSQGNPACTYNTPRGLVEWRVSMYATRLHKHM